MKVINSGSPVMVPAELLKPHPKNPRRGDEFAIANSIQENGFYGVILVQRSTGYVISGWHRHLAGVREGMGEFPVVYVDCNDETALRILLSDNRTRDLGAYDELTLLETLRQIESGWGASELAGTGYTPDDISAIAARLSDDVSAIEIAVHRESDVMIRVGDLQSPISHAEYLKWIDGLRYSVGFSPKAITAEILSRLGLSNVS